MVSASSRSICALVEPAAPKARRQNCNRAEAVLALLRIRSSANSRSSGLGLSSSTSRPLTMAPTGLMRSWQTREHNSAANSRASGAGGEVPDISGFLGDLRGGFRRNPLVALTDANHAWLAGLIHCGRAGCQHK